ncbi:MAG: DUF4330 domain-containing protein [Coleofasciculus sp. C1-SOL-03]|jgi:hypothetical protein|uniref:DUF4330 domain-containing protein n=1 Tax=Coleofasciculus sp. C1-SOL-03 TaxID=3069522 RepID=UPI00330088A1
MTILDSKGRLFGKVSILDLGAALVILLVIVGIFVVPGTSGSVAQLPGSSATKAVEVDLIVRGLSVRHPEDLMSQFREEKKTNIVIRNQPAGKVDIVSVKELPRLVIVPQPDGSAKALPDPRPDTFSTDILMTLGGQATITDDGPVLGNSKLKIGTPVELEGKDYNFNASVIDVRVE